ncbi:hypothetical protein [Erythrobacter sp.]|uniref:hypothetical protein n=1 Tax=Erythrobacter sp. TaxID=1042 RepID=UPI0025F765FA|nr:hypothetical protein [Erythrobacter sp.]
MTTVIFVYNADGGLLNALRDMVHKIASPLTYPCSLCALTYGAFAMRSEWRAYLAGLEHEKLFLYRDELREDLDPRPLELPAILLARGPGEPELLVSASELDSLPDLAALIALLDNRLGLARQPGLRP